jgi:hypothetical protein
MALTIGATRTTGVWTPHHMPCQATLRHEVDPCPNFASRPLNNGLCAACDLEIHRTMMSTLYSVGDFALAAELDALYKARAYCPYCLGVRACGCAK